VTGRADSAPAAALSRLAAACDGVIDRGHETEITGITHDSRQARPGDLFVALPGERADGRTFIPDAAAAGVVAVASQEERREGEADGLPWMRVEDARRALAAISWEFWERPDRRMALVGITGTNGKTSTAWILERILRSAGRPVALLGTLLYRYGGRQEAASHTTPEAPVLGRWLHEAASDGAWGAVMEVSSHALAMERVSGLEYRAALFTNLDREHLDFHGTMEEYGRTKGRLFGEGLAGDGVAVCNADDPHGPGMAELAPGRSVLFGRGAGADLRITAIEAGMKGVRVKMEGLASLDIASPLMGEVSAWNIAGAAATALALDVDPAVVAEAVSGMPGVPGRMQAVGEGQDFSVLVDYAHTGDALESLLQGVRAMGASRVITVFGCGGDRDASKRAVLGRVAAEHSDLVIITDDNPRHEDPEAILGQVLEGVRGVEGYAVRVEHDRKRALEMAVRVARPGDVVVAAGKGAEEYQQYGDERRPWNEVETLREAIRLREHGEGA
jgi:UDP-N-acetylmuramoyl-L-alanyl-D-glutamate--2,6-diaminopimelate ligase